MKRRMILTTLLFLIIVIGFSVYLNNRKTGQQSITEQLSTFKQHEHIAPDGTVVKHQHTYEVPELSEGVVKPKPVSESRHPIQRAWEALDLAAIKRKYQPYTVAEMQEMWSQSYMTNFGPNYPHELDEAYPQEEWLQHNLELGQHFADFTDYETTLERRYMMVDHRDKWKVKDEVGREEMRGYLDLPSYVDTWEEYEDAFLKTLITSYHTFVVATESDPDIEGGTVGTDGTLIPFKKNTVYVHVNIEKGFSTFTGTELTNDEENTLTMYGVVPEGLTVIYTDEGGKPLSSDTPPPTFHARRMKELEQAQTYLQQQITDHEVLLELDAILNPQEKGAGTTSVPHEHEHEQEHDHTHETLQPPDKVTPQQSNAKQPLPHLKIPPELRTPEAINQWFTELEVLHGGQLPKDLQALREVITELEKIRQEGEAKLKPPQPPERPAPPEGNSPPDKTD